MVVVGGGGTCVSLSMGKATILQSKTTVFKNNFLFFGGVGGGSGGAGGVRAGGAGGGGAGGGIFTVKHAILINLRTDAKISLLIQSGSQKVVEDHAITGKNHSN